MNDTTYPEWQHHPFRLNQDELNDPSIVLTEFAQSRTLPEHREMLNAIVKAALGSAKDNYTTAEEVSEWVLYCMRLEQLIEAVHLSHNFSLKAV